MKVYVMILRVKGLTKLVSNSPKVLGSMVTPLTISIKANIMSQVWVTEEATYRFD